MQSTTQWILGLDGGGSSSTARLIERISGRHWQVEGGPSSLSVDPVHACENINKMLSQLVKLSGASLNETAAHFGVAGASDERKSALLIQHFADKFYMFDHSNDAVTSAYGANRGEPVVVVALGTGSVGMRLEADGNTRLVGGWGFLIGDQGSGAKLGVAAIEHAVIELESRRDNLTKLSQFICDIVGHNRTDITRWVAAAKPANFAAFAKSIFAIATECQQAQKLLEQHVKDVEALIIRCREQHQLPVVIMGGLGDATAKRLSPQFKQLLMQGKGTGLDGACLLAQQMLDQKTQLA